MPTLLIVPILKKQIPVRYLRSSNNAGYNMHRTGYRYLKLAAFKIRNVSIRIRILLFFSVAFGVPKQKIIFSSAMFLLVTYGTIFKFTAVQRKQVIKKSENCRNKGFSEYAC
jgi:hypothetical protein